MEEEIICMISHLLCVSNLPFDIIFQILLHLHVKTLCKLRCVCKAWNALISSPMFIQRYLEQAKKKPLLLRATWYNDIHTECLNLQFTSLDKDNYTIISEFTKLTETVPECSLLTCLDLVCIYDYQKIYLCNPATQELVTLPAKSTPEDHNSFYCCCSVGFGYIPSSGDYKVFRACEAFDKSTWRCEVFTLSSSPIDGHGRWKEVAKSPFKFLGDAIFSEGAFYFLPNSNAHPFVARFNLEREDWSVIPLPSSENMHAWCLTLVQIGESIWLEDLRSWWDQLELWLLEDYTNGVWLKKYSININNTSVARLLAIEEDGRLLMELLGDDIKLQHYDPKNKCFEAIDIGDLTIFGYHNFYVESFTSLRSMLN